MERCKKIRELASSHRGEAIFALLLFILLFIWVIPMKDTTNWKVEIEYAQYDDNYAQKASVGYVESEEEAGSFTQLEYYVINGHFSNSTNHSLETVFIYPESTGNEEAVVSKINFCSYGRTLFSIKGTEIFDYFITYDDSEKYQMQSEGLKVESGALLCLIGGDKLNQLLDENRDRAKLPLLKIILTGIVLAFSAAIGVEFLCRKKEKKSFWEEGVLKNILWRFVLAILCLCYIPIVLISTFSPLDSHPDEKVSYYAVEYYETHNGLADIRDADTVHTFSSYGYSRLRELTPYYYIAGKVSSLLKNIPGLMTYRCLNLILLAGILMIALCWGMKYKGLIFALCLTPQLLYLFSYTTSDALDVFLCYLLLYQILKEDSCLNQIAFQWQGIRKMAGKIVWVSLICGFLLLSKMNFWFILLFVGCYYAILWFVRIRKEDKIRYLFSMLCILAGALIIVGVRYLMDYSVYGTEKAQIVNELKNQYTHFSVMVDETAAQNEYEGSIYLKSQGVTALQMITEKDFFGKLWANACGGFGYRMLFSANIFAKIGWLVIWLLVLLSGFLYAYVEKNQRFTVFLVLGVFVAAVGVVFHHSWTSDFQPQARYLMSCFILLGIICQENKENTLRWSRVSEMINISAALLGSLLCLYILVFSGVIVFM